MKTHYIVLTSSQPVRKPYRTKTLKVRDKNTTV